MSQPYEITVDDVVSQAEGNLVSSMDGDKVMMSIRTGKYYNLGQTGGRIWELIEEPVAVSRVVSTLLSEYDINTQDCENQVLAFIQHLAKEELIHVGEKISS